MAIPGERIEEAVCGTVAALGRLAYGAGEGGRHEKEIESFLIGGLEKGVVEVPGSDEFGGEGGVPVGGAGV